MAKRKSKTKELTSEEWVIKRASSFRASSLARAKTLGIMGSDIPSASEIRDWLRSQIPWVCYLTGTPIPKGSIEIDHKTPVSRGGSLNFDNLGITTKWYNNAKGDMLESEFRGLLSELSKWEDKGKRIITRLVASNNIFKRR